MPAASPPTPNLKQVVPFFGVMNMEASLKFYIDGLGFHMKYRWIPDAAEQNPEGRIRWCWVERDNTALMLQEFVREHRPKETLGTGVSVCIMCEDALALYREFQSRGVPTRHRPFVGNHLWVVSVSDPDGYRIDFESPTDVPEDTELQE